MGHANENCCNYSTFSECSRSCNLCQHCYDLSISKLRDIIYSINNEIVDYSCGIVSKAKYGYQVCNNLTEEKFQILLNYKDSLSKYYLETIRKQEHCLCPEEIQYIYERTLELVDINCCKSPDREDLIIDSSGKDVWNSLHQGCIPYEDWEKATLQLFFKIGITAKTITDPTLLGAKPSVKSLSGMCALFSEMQTGAIKNPSKVLSALNAYNRIKAKVTKEECRLSYSLLVSKTNCTLSYDVYSSLINCNLTPSIISRLIECNLTLEYNVQKDTCDIVINPDVTISLCDLDFNMSSQNISCTLLAEVTGEPNICEELAQIIEI